MKKKIGFLALALGLSVSGIAQQDKHFSMFAEAPVYLNPAAAGFSPGNLQLFTNFRMQWLPFKWLGVLAAVIAFLYSLYIDFIYKKIKK